MGAQEAGGLCPTLLSFPETGHGKDMSDDVTPPGPGPAPGFQPALISVALSTVKGGDVPLGVFFLRSRTQQSVPIVPPESAGVTSHLFGGSLASSVPFPSGPERSAPRWNCRDVCGSAGSTRGVDHRPLGKPPASGDGTTVVLRQSAVRGRSSRLAAGHTRRSL